MITIISHRLILNSPTSHLIINYKVKINEIDVLNLIEDINIQHLWTVVNIENSLGDYPNLNKFFE